MRIINSLRNRMKRKYYDMLFKKKKEVIREESEPIYYIIRRYPPGAGFFSNMYWVLGHVLYAEEKSYIPIVDMRNYETLYTSNSEKDAWYSYFEKQDNLKHELKNIYKKCNYILSDNVYLKDYCQKYCGEYAFPSSESVAFYTKYINKYFRVKKEYLCLVDEFFKDNIDGCVIGVHIRGTDMKTEGGEHIVPASIEDYIKEIDKLLSETEVNVIFLATDEKESIERIKQSFPDKRIVHTEALRADDSWSGGIHNSERYRNHIDCHFLGEQVLIDMLILSRCDYLICGNSNVSNAAILFNKNDYKKIIKVSKQKEDS